MSQTRPPTHVLREPKAVRGFLYWAVLIAGITLWVFFSEPIKHIRDLPASPLRQYLVIAASSASSKALFLFGGCLTIGLCIVWYLLSRKRIRRKSLIARFFGSLLFGLGSYLFLMNFVHPALFEFSFSSANGQIEPIEFDWIQTVLMLIIGSLISGGHLIASYFLYFTRFSSMTASPSTSFRSSAPASSPEDRVY